MWEKLASLQGGAECRVRGVLPPEADPGLRPLFWLTQAWTGREAVGASLSL